MKSQWSIKGCWKNSGAAGLDVLQWPPSSHKSGFGCLSVSQGSCDCEPMNFSRWLYMMTFVFTPWLKFFSCPFTVGGGGGGGGGLWMYILENSLPTHCVTWLSGSASFLAGRGGVVQKHHVSTIPHVKCMVVRRVMHLLVRADQTDHVQHSQQVEVRLILH